MSTDFFSFSIANTVRRIRSRSLPRESTAQISANSDFSTLPIRRREDSVERKTKIYRKPPPPPTNHNGLHTVVISKEKKEKIGLGIKFYGGLEKETSVKRLFVLTVAESSPAARVILPWGGIREGDEIIAISEVEVNRMSRGQIIEELTGDKSLVAIKFLKASCVEIRQEERAVDCPVGFRETPLAPPVPPRKKKRRFANFASLLRSRKQSFDLDMSHMHQTLDDSSSSLKSVRALRTMEDFDHTLHSSSSLMDLSFETSDSGKFDTKQNASILASLHLSSPTNGPTLSSQHPLAVSSRSRDADTSRNRVWLESTQTVLKVEPERKLVNAPETIKLDVRFDPNSVTTRRCNPTRGSGKVSRSVKADEPENTSVRNNGYDPTNYLAEQLSSDRTQFGKSNDNSAEVYLKWKTDFEGGLKLNQGSVLKPDLKYLEPDRLDSSAVDPVPETDGSHVDLSLQAQTLGSHAINEFFGPSMEGTAMLGEGFEIGMHVEPPSPFRMMTSSPQPEIHNKIETIESDNAFKYYEREKSDTLSTTPVHSLQCLSSDQDVESEGSDEFFINEAVNLSYAISEFNVGFFTSGKAAMSQRRSVSETNLHPFTCGFDTENEFESYVSESKYERNVIYVPKRVVPDVPVYLRHTSSRSCQPKTALEVAASAQMVEGNIAENQDRLHLNQHTSRRTWRRQVGYDGNELNAQVSEADFVSVMLGEAVSSPPSICEAEGKCDMTVGSSGYEYDTNADFNMCGTEDDSSNVISDAIANLVAVRTPSKHLIGILEHDLEELESASGTANVFEKEFEAFQAESSIFNWECIGYAGGANLLRIERGESPIGKTPFEVSGSENEERCVHTEHLKTLVNNHGQPSDSLDGSSHFSSDDITETSLEPVSIDSSIRGYVVGRGTKKSVSFQNPLSQTGCDLPPDSLSETEPTRIVRKSRKTCSQRSSATPIGRKVQAQLSSERKDVTASTNEQEDREENSFTSAEAESAKITTRTGRLYSHRSAASPAPRKSRTVRDQISSESQPKDDPALSEENSITSLETLATSIVPRKRKTYSQRCTASPVGRKVQSLRKCDDRKAASGPSQEVGERISARNARSFSPKGVVRTISQEKDASPEPESGPETVSKADQRESRYKRNGALSRPYRKDYKENFASLLRMSNEDLKRLPKEKRKEHIQAIKTKFLRGQKAMSMSTPDLSKHGYSTSCSDTDDSITAAKSSDVSMSLGTDRYGRSNRSCSSLSSANVGSFGSLSSLSHRSRIERLEVSSSCLQISSSSSDIRKLSKPSVPRLSHRSASDMMNSMPSSLRVKPNPTNSRNARRLERDSESALEIIPVRSSTKVSDVRKNKGSSRSGTLEDSSVRDSSLELSGTMEVIERTFEEKRSIRNGSDDGFPSKVTEPEVESKYLKGVEENSDDTMDSTALMVRHSREHSMEDGPPKSRPPPDGDEFPVEFQDPGMNEIISSLKKQMPVPRPRSNLPPRDTGKPPLWSRRADEKSEKSVRAKIALFSSDENPRVSPVLRSPSVETRPNGQDLSRSVDNLNAVEPTQRIISPQPLVKSRRSLQEKSQSLLDVATASAPRRSLTAEPQKSERKFSSLLDSRKKSMSKLKGLVIPDVQIVKQVGGPKVDLPEIISADSIFAQDTRPSPGQAVSPQSYSRSSSMSAYKSQNLSTVHARLGYINDSGIQENDQDTDTDSAVSSSRSSMSPPPSPPPHYSDAYSITPDKEEPRVLKPDSVEALNRRNVLRSARFSNGAKSDDDNAAAPCPTHTADGPRLKELEVQVAFLTDVTDSRPPLSPSPRRLDTTPPVPTQRNFLRVSKEETREVEDGIVRITRTSSFSRVEVERTERDLSAEDTCRISRTPSFSKKQPETQRSYSPFGRPDVPEPIYRTLRPSPTSLRKLSDSPTYETRRTSASNDDFLRRLSPIPTKRDEPKLTERRSSFSNEETLRSARTSPLPPKKLENTEIKAIETRSSFSKGEGVRTSPPVSKQLEMIIRVEESSKTFDELVFPRNDPARLELLKSQRKEARSPTSIKALTQRFEQINVDKLAKNKAVDNKTASVNDIRRAFEKAEKSLSNSDDCGGASPNSQSPPNTLKRYQQPHGIFSIGMNISSHARVSSIDSTTSEDNSLTNVILPSIRDHFGSITSLASTTSLISPQELQQLIEDANQSLEESGTPCHEIVVVVLHRGESMAGVGSMSLGITLAGGADHEMKEITVHKIISGSVADRDGRIQRGDRVLSVNGRSFKGVTHREALQILKAPRPEVVLVLSRSRSSTPQESSVEESSQTPTRNLSISPIFNSGRPPRILESPSDANHSLGSDSPDGSRGDPVVTVIYKDGAGLGFSLEGGKDSPLGDRPLTIKKVFAGGTAAKSGVLRVGDQILAVNGCDATNMSRLEAWNLMKKLPDGDVHLTVAHLNSC